MENNKRKIWKCGHFSTFDNHLITPAAYGPWCSDKAKWFGHLSHIPIRLFNEQAEWGNKCVGRAPSRGNFSNNDPPSSQFSLVTAILSMPNHPYFTYSLYEENAEIQNTNTNFHSLFSEWALSILSEWYIDGEIFWHKHKKVWEGKGLNLLSEWENWFQIKRVNVMLDPPISLLYCPCSTVPDRIPPIWSDTCFSPATQLANISKSTTERTPRQRFFWNLCFDWIYNICQKSAGWKNGLFGAHLFPTKSFAFGFDISAKWISSLWPNLVVITALSPTCYLEPWKYILAGFSALVAVLSKI